MDNKQVAKVLKALSHPNRLELYLEIARKSEANFETGEECFLTDIIGRFNIGAPTISHHLKELTNAGLIVTERRGKYLSVKINQEVIAEVNDALSLKKKKE